MSISIESGRLRVVMCLLALVAGISIVSPASAQDRPNILIIWGDDIGAYNISVYKSSIHLTLGPRRSVV